MPDYKLCTLADVKRYTPITTGYLNYDTLITNLIPSVSAQIMAHMRRELVKAERKEYFSSTQGFMGERRFKLTVKEPPIAASPALVLEYDYSTNFKGGQTLLVADTDYKVVDAENGVVEIYTYWERGEDRFRVTYTGGYDVAQSDALLIQAPISIATATALQTAHVAQRIIGQTVGMTHEERTPNLRIDYKSDGFALLPSVTALLNSGAAPRRVLVGRN